MELSITLIIIIITCIISISAFSNQRIIDDLIFYPPAVTEHKQWYRFFSCGLIHGDYLHLIFNMYAFYSFGTRVENGIPYSNIVGKSNGFVQIFGMAEGKILYLLMYVLALGFCLLPTFAKHKHDYYYRSLGASGAVSAVVFAGLILEPRTGVGLLFLPVSIPGYLFAPIYLAISHYLSKKGRDNINHSAHIWGSIFGVLFIVAFCYALSDHDPIRSFIESIKMDINGS